MPQVKDGHRYSGVAGLQFRMANQENDPAALPRIDPAACYGIQYGKGGGYSSARFYGYGHPNIQPSDTHEMQGQPGDPAKYEINVDGVILKYDEGGRVFNLRGHLVGTLLCYRSNECERYRYTKPGIPVTQGVSCNGMSWYDFSNMISKRLKEEDPYKMLKDVFLDKKTYLSCLVKGPSSPLAEDIQALLEKFLESGDADQLDELYNGLEKAVDYAHDYGVPSIPNYSVLGSLWLAIAKTQATRSPGASERSVYAVSKLVDGRMAYDDLIRDSVLNSYTEVSRLPEAGGAFSWKRKSDGKVHQPYSTESQAVDVRIVELSNEAAKAINNNPTLNSLNGVSGLWYNVERVNPFIIPDADSDEVHADVAAVLEKLLNLAYMSPIEIHADPAKGLGGTTWRWGKRFGLMVLIPEELSAVAPRMPRMLCPEPCVMSVYGEFKDLPGRPTYEGFTRYGAGPQTWYVAFQRNGGGTYLISTSGPATFADAQDSAEIGDAHIRDAIYRTDEDLNPN